MKKKGIILLIIFIAAVALTFSITKPPQTTKITSVGSKPYDLELTDINKNRIKLTDLKGSVVLVNFWATWCGSCVDELPSMERLFKLLSVDPGFKMVTILYKDDLQQASGFMKQNGFTFPVYINPDESGIKTFGLTGVPETFILDKQGLLRHKVIGPEDWDSPRVIEALRTLINEP
jgi:cytochrome c biogenesis protein CcmG, thiol:disulfide interchange protein DsbE